MEWWVSFLAASIRLGTPILIAALGGVYMARSGVVNIGIEGTMLFGALAGMMGSFFLGSPVAGSLVAMLVGALIGLLFAYLVVTIGADQIVMGMAINLLALGMTTFLFRAIFVSGIPSQAASYTAVQIPFLSTIPLVGSLLFSHPPLVYLAYVLVPLAGWVLYKTPYGLRVRAVGEFPKAVDTLGISVFKLRYSTLIVGGMLSGLAGSYLSISELNMFTENMTAGKGFVALAAVIFGRWTPVGAMLAALLFGGMQAFQMRMQIMGTDIPFQFFLMLPYVVTVVVLTGFVGKATPPAASTKPYKREKII